MTDIGSSIVVASMIVGMLTIPAASKTINSSSGVSADLPNISSSNSIPKQVSTNSSPDSFTRRVETAFQEFTTEVSSESVKTSVESAGSRLKIQKKPSGTSWTLESSPGKLVITKSPSKTVEKVETPYGSLKKVREDGGTRESFEGSDRQKVEEIAQKLREEMKDRKQDIQNQRKASETNQYSRSIEIDEINRTEDYLVITNDMSMAVDLEGWELTDDSDTGVYKFKDAEIPANGELYVYRKESSEHDVEEKEGANYVYDSGLNWNRYHDTATLWKDGSKVAEKSY